MSSNWPLPTLFRVLLALVFMWGGALACWLFQDLTVPWDAKNQIYPMMRFLAREIAAGEVPLWNMTHYAGHPTVADPQSLLFNPTLVWLAFVNAAPSVQAFDTLIFAHLLVGALGLVLYGRQRGLAPLAVVMMALVFMLGGVAASRLQHSMMIVSYGLTPLALFALDRLILQSRWRDALFFGVIGGVIALGRDQVAFLMGLSLMAYAAAMFWNAPHKLRLVLQLTLSSVIALLLLSVPAILTMQLIATSNRPEIGIGTALQGSFSPLNLATLFFPNIYGAFSGAYYGPGPDTIAAGDWTDRTINTVFTGSIPVLLILIMMGRVRERLAVFFLVGMIVALLFALGRHTPFFGWVYELIPGVSLYRRPADALFVFQLMLACSVGFAFHAWVGGQPAFPLSLSMVFAAVLAGFGLVFVQQTSGSMSLSLIALLFPMAMMLSASLVLGVSVGMRQRFAALIVIFTFFELLAWNVASPLNAEPRSVYTPLTTPDADDQRLLDVLALHAKDARVEVLGLSGAWQNAAMAHGFEAVTGYNALRLAQYEELTGLAQNSSDPNLREFPMTFRGYESPLAQMLGLKLLVFGKSLDDLPPHIPRPDVRPLMLGPRAWVYMLPASAPKAYVAYSVRPAPRDLLPDRDDFPDFEMGYEVLLGAEAAVSLRPIPEEERSSLAPADVQIVERRSNRVRLSVQSTREGVLVLHDLFYPGWVVRVNGAEKPLLRANQLFRGVEIGAGTSDVEFSFEPFSAQNLRNAFQALRSRPN